MSEFPRIGDLTFGRTPRALDVCLCAVSVTTSLRQLEIVAPTHEEVTNVSRRMGRPLSPGEQLFVLKAGAHRYFVVASGWAIEENTLGRFDSGFTNTPQG
jgi:hypothetical protein